MHGQILQRVYIPGHACNEIRAYSGTFWEAECAMHALILLKADLLHQLGS